MTRFLIAVAAFGCLSAPAFADVCSAATEAATRAALASAEASGRRTSTVRVACGGEKQTLVLHRIDGASGSSVSVREVKKPEGAKMMSASSKGDFSPSSASRVIRVKD
jgi:hypothetical protein